MSLIFVDGFDHYSSADYGKKWDSISGSPGIAAGGGRRGTNAYSCSSNAYLRKSFAQHQTLVAGFAFKGSSDAGGTTIFAFCDGTSPQLSLYRRADGKLQLFRGPDWGTLLGTTDEGIPVSVWSYIELKATIDPAVGAYELRVNGATVLSGSSANTRSTTNSFADSIFVGHSNNVAVDYYDDFYLLDSAGTLNNTFLGDCRIDTIYPSAEGTYSAFTPSSGGVHYSRVNDATPDTATYNEGATLGDRDSYAFPDLPALAAPTVFAVQVNPAMRKSDSGARGAAGFARLDGVNLDGAGQALGTDQRYYMAPMDAAPGGAIWTAARVNAAEFGVVVTS